MSRRGFAYMLRCADGSYYVGSTTDLELRLHQHNEGLGASHTRHRRPVVLVWHEEFDRVDDAFAREKQVQNWSRAKREALIRGDYTALPSLSEPTSRRRRREMEAGEGG
ncbi:GIY-YIG nuclease family protein [Nocardioides sp. CFH 31398]|uniref:GIY-YIG nuclease family protein n=1 Tax=Nocardioides sp. CFH 31398 TaxID=2919579 RepID=UPI001F0556DF|nr:GIY-YIG nuclease family protein [Nocardioides sp. CFH 31398]MCH1864955.1 GIY-YIG nuclease family protein [Nocardioides sp. CFH 31398]